MHERAYSSCKQEPRDQLLREQVLWGRVPAGYGVAAFWQPLSLHLCLLMFLGLLLLVVIFAWNADIKTTVRVSGVLVADGGLLPITAAAQGVYGDVLVREGDTVRAGQVLARVSRARHGSDGHPMQRTTSDFLALQLEQLDTGREQLLQDNLLQHRQMAQSIHGVAQEIEFLAEEYAISAQRQVLEENEKKLLARLLENMIISETEYQRQYAAYLMAKQQLVQLRHRLTERESRLAELTLAREALPLELEKRLLEAQQQENRLRHEYRVQLQEIDLGIVAGTDGIVTGWTAIPGDAVQAGEVLGHILPADTPLEALLFLPGEAAGIVGAGQQVLLNYDAFPFQTHGNHRGSIVSVSRNAVDPRRQLLPLPGVQQSVYLLRASLPSQSVRKHGGETYSLRPGMGLQAEIVTAEMRLLQYVLDPVLRLINK